VKRHIALRNIPVYPKDGLGDEEKSEMIYKTPSKNCDLVYIGETGRPFETIVNEHYKDVECITVVCCF